MSDLAYMRWYFYRLYLLELGHKENISEKELSKMLNKMN